MAQQGKDLEFKYDNYEDDFHNDQQAEKKDFNIQTDNPHKKTQSDHYEQDFNEFQNSSKIPIKLNPDREKMIQQNIKLKTQIFELAKQMDEILSREKKRKKYGIHAEEEDNEYIQQKKNQLKKQQIQILQLKNKINMTKRQLQQVYDSRGIQQKQNQLKNLEIHMKKLQDQREGLLRIKKQQIKALNLVKDSQQYENKVKILKEQQSKLRQQCAKLTEKLVQNQRVLRKSHEQYVIKQNRIKQMEQKIKENKQKSKKSKDINPTVTNQMIAEIENQLSQVQNERKASQKNWIEKIHTAQTELQQKKIEEEKKLLILKQKERQLKLNQIKIKQLKKLIYHHKQQLNTSKKSPENGENDLKEYRHKRNIKYLQKK